MPSRFFRRAIDWSAYRARLDLIPPPGIEPPEPQYNIAPGAFAPILRIAPDGEYAPRGAIQIALAYWGLIPVWWNRPLSEKTFSTFNARAEGITESNTFSGAFRQGRCLVPASGFYAWSGPKGAATPFAIGPADHTWFCFAGLWSRWMYEGSEIDTFAIITCEPNLAVAGLSESMPVIPALADYTAWLDPLAQHPERLLKPSPPDALRVWTAHPAVGNVRNQGAEVTGEPDAPAPVGPRSPSQ
jgi:putative SOS response-associated peptidase YedK